MEDPEDAPGTRLLTYSQSLREQCVFCRKAEGLKLPFCRVCARMEGGVQMESTYVHRSCAEKHMDRRRKIKCSSCENVMTMVYSGALHDDYALRNMREAFRCCFPSADQTLAFNFISVKHTLLAILALGLFVAYTVVASQASEGSWLLAAKVLHTVGFVSYLLSWFISSSSTLLYIILYGSIHKAKQQLVTECVLYLAVTAVSLVSSVAWKTLLALDLLFGVWVIIVSAAVLSIFIIALLDKMKTYAGLSLVGITMQVHPD